MGQTIYLGAMGIVDLRGHAITIVLYAP